MGAAWDIFWSRPASRAKPLLFQRTVSTHARQITPLLAAANITGMPRDEVWKVAVNVDVEAEFLIPRDYITEWRAQAPWVQDIQVEQDLVICRALVATFSHPLLAEALAFRGGTALYKLYFRPAARYSEDIDLVGIACRASGCRDGSLAGRPRSLARRAAVKADRRASRLPVIASVLKIRTRTHAAEGGDQLP